MMEDLLGKFCSMLTLFSIHELCINDVLENFYEMQKREEFSSHLNPRKLEKEEFCLSLLAGLKTLQDKQIVIKNENYVFVFHEQEQLKKWRNCLSLEEKKFILKCIDEYIKLNMKKQKKKIAIYDIKRENKI